jgi:hypothetical protein
VVELDDREEERAKRSKLQQIDEEEERKVGKKEDKHLEITSKLENGEDEEKDKDNVGL